ncbi:head-to-tail adaptor [Streptomyces phage Bmoc]|uniref:Head-to-tail adaptor n=1 Tax=Streptomyces phage Bmoc TaxID=2725629 RepID=A0A6M3SYR8_9CAUD|nr:head-to-tail adaptor [Streptomyces phage Bmoc]QJD50799.1 head-to-tail adaptor [Streptomyces phage Bmoc]
MEIYRDTTSTVTLEHPVTGPLTADVYRGDEVISANQAVTSTTGKHTTTIDWNLTEYDGQLKIVWKKTGFSRATWVDVVTPIVPLSELEALLDDVAESDRYDAEAVVRRIIEVYTGQSFGKFRGTKDVAGNDSTRLALPMPLLSFTEMTDSVLSYEPSSFRITGEGWFLGQAPGAWWTIKDAPPEEVLDQFSDGVIYAPGTIKKRDFSYTSVYTITGDWGYESVPYPVIQAAKMLISDYACQDSSYRDKYLESMKAADWRIQFTQAAYDGTGNLKADQLLEPYRLVNMVVI